MITPVKFSLDLVKVSNNSSRGFVLSYNLTRADDHILMDFMFLEVVVFIYIVFNYTPFPFI